MATLIHVHVCVCVYICVNLRRFIKPQVEMYLHCSTKQIFHFSCQTQSLQTVVATVHVLNVCNIVFLYMYSDKFCYLTLFIDIHVTCNVQCRLFLKTENLTHTCMYMSQGPQSHILMTGGG